MLEVLCWDACLATFAGAMILNLAMALGHLRASGIAIGAVAFLLGVAMLCLVPLGRMAAGELFVGGSVLLYLAWRREELARRINDYHGWC